jgi:hypothetical protein
MNSWICNKQVHRERLQIQYNSFSLLPKHKLYFLLLARCFERRSGSSQKTWDGTMRYCCTLPLFGTTRQSFRILASYLFLKKRNHDDFEKRGAEARRFCSTLIGWFKSSPGVSSRGRASYTRKNNQNCDNE